LPDTAERETVYKSAAAEFELSRIQLQEGETVAFATTTADVLLQTEGAATVTASGGDMNLKKGEALLITAGATVKITGNGNAQLFRATVPGG
jgi:mannose-6-phosphate isomerase class I